MIRLQERDFHLLKKLSSFGILSTKQVAKYIFCLADTTIVLRRLRNLEAAGLILNCGHLKNAEKVWSLSKDGANSIGASEPFRFANQNTIYHDVCLSELRFTFDEINLGTDWTAEHELKRLAIQSNQSFIPDGIFLAKVDNKDQVVAIELELHAKSHKRYRRLLAEYFYKDSIGVIWYVVKDVSIIKPILMQWQAVQAKKYGKPTQKIFFSIFDDIIKNKIDSKITDENLEMKCLREVFDTQTSCQGLGNTDNKPLGTCESKIHKESQLVGSVSKFFKDVPSALDSSPTTCVEESRPTGT